MSDKIKTTSADSDQQAGETAVLPTNAATFPPVAVLAPSQALVADDDGVGRN